MTTHTHSQLAKPADRLREILADLADNPHKAADRLEDMARQLMHLARKLREEADSRSGMGDRVQMRVVGPDGGEKQYADAR